MLEQVYGDQLSFLAPTSLHRGRNAGIWQSCPRVEWTFRWVRSKKSGTWTTLESGDLSRCICIPPSILSNSHVEDPLEDCWVSNDPPMFTPKVNGYPFPNFGQDPASRLTVHSYYTHRQTHKSVCLCNTNGRPNGLPDLDQNLGMDSHLPWG